MITTDYTIRNIQNRPGTQTPKKKITELSYIKGDSFCHRLTNHFSYQVKFIRFLLSPNCKFKNCHKNENHQESSISTTYISLFFFFFKKIAVTTPASFRVLIFLIFYSSLYNNNTNQTLCAYRQE